MQADFAMSKGALEKRWQALQQDQEPAAASDASTRSPLAALRVDEQTTALKRAREQKEDSETQQRPRSRPPLSSSPRTLSVPRELLASRCPTFLLAPKSSLKAPDSVRRQLKAVYLATLLKRAPSLASPEPFSPQPASREPRAAQRWPPAAEVAKEDSPRPHSASACDHSAIGDGNLTRGEKSAIVELLARELAVIKQGGHRAGRAGRASPTPTSPLPASRSSPLPASRSSPLPPKKTWLHSAHRSGVDSGAR